MSNPDSRAREAANSFVRAVLERVAPRLAGERRIRVDVDAIALRGERLDLTWPPPVPEPDPTSLQ